MGARVRRRDATLSDVTKRELMLRSTQQLQLQQPPRSQQGNSIPAKAAAVA